MPKRDWQRGAASFSTNLKPCSIKSDSDRDGSVHQALGEASHLHRGWTGLEVVEGTLDLALRHFPEGSLPPTTPPPAL